MNSGVKRSVLALTAALLASAAAQFSVPSAAVATGNLRPAAAPVKVTEVVRPEGHFTWQQLTPPVSPAPRSGFAMAYHRAGHRVIMFGGQVFGGRLNDTWAWDGSTWEQLHPTTSPPARNGAAFAYDPVRNESVLFGGIDGDTPTPDTWVFNGDQWTQRHPATSPPSLIGAKMAFDPNLRQLLMFGGNDYDGVGFTKQTWTWDGTTWTKLQPAHAPAPRVSHGLAYHPTRGTLILFGGGQGYPTDFGDTWSWDGKDWTQLSPSLSPPRRFSHAMATFGRRAVIFGGNRWTGDPYKDTWVLRSTDEWANRSRAMSPHRRWGSLLEWDSARHEAVLFGGVVRGQSTNETWTLTRPRG